MGADIVIAVDISARPAGTQASSMLGLLDQTINIMGQQSINEELKQATVVIQPKVGHLGALDLKASNDAILKVKKQHNLKFVLFKARLINLKSPAALQPPPRPNSKVIFTQPCQVLLQ